MNDYEYEYEYEGRHLIMNMNSLPRIAHEAKKNSVKGKMFTTA